MIVNGSKSQVGAICIVCMQKNWTKRTYYR